MGTSLQTVLMSPPVQSTSPVHWSSPVIVDAIYARGVHTNTSGRVVVCNCCIGSAVEGSLCHHVVG